MFSQPENNLAQINIDPGMSVADLGSGAGNYTFLIAQLVGPSGKVYAVDVQKDLLEKLKSEANNQKIHNIDTVWSDLDLKNGTGLLDNSVDRVIIANTLFQIEDKDNFIKEAYRILKPNGKLLFIDWSDSFGGMGPQSKDVIKSDVARTLIESENFVFDKEISAGDHHYGFIFKKL